MNSGMCRRRYVSVRIGWLGVADTRLVQESRPEFKTVNK